jgi:hypothetical protein
MKKIVVAVGLAALVATVGCLEQVGGTRAYKGPLFHYHYAGRAHLPTGTNAARFREIDAMPATAELRAELSAKLAAAAVPFWRADLPAGATDQSALLKPLLEDFWVAEAMVEVRGAAGKTDSVLAIELSDARAQIWDRNLRQVMAAWKLGAPAELTVEGFKGWGVKRAQAPNTFQYFRAGRWVVLGLGQDRLAQLPALLAEAKKSGRPVVPLTNDFLELAMDLPGLRPWAPVLAKWPLPPVTLSMSPRGDAVRTEAKFEYSGKIPWTFEPWKIPTNIVSEPLTSFTLGQGIAPLLKQVPGITGAGLSPLPNQFCLWGINQEQCRMFFTVPVADGTNAIRQMATKLPVFFKSLLTNSQGQFLYVSNRAELILGGVPFIVPMLRPEKNGRDDFLFGAIFPPSPKPVPPPDELYAQVRGRNNLIYYDWEITEQRLTHAKQFYQLLSIVNGTRLPGTNTVSKRWLSAIGPKLGNTVTEITQTSPQELALVRKSHVGFTGFELATLSAWMDSPGFPLTFELPGPVARVGSDLVPRKNSPPGSGQNTTPPKAGLPAAKTPAPAAPKAPANKPR